jgi:hypothetical protein
MMFLHLIRELVAKLFGVTTRVALSALSAPEKGAGYRLQSLTRFQS